VRELRGVPVVDEEEVQAARPIDASGIPVTLLRGMMKNP
jgi:hypothetical protein